MFNYHNHHPLSSSHFFLFPFFLLCLFFFLFPIFHFTFLTFPFSPFPLESLPTLFGHLHHQYLNHNLSLLLFLVQPFLLHLFPSSNLHQLLFSFTASFPAPPPLTLPPTQHSLSLLFLSRTQPSLLPHHSTTTSAGPRSTLTRVPGVGDDHGLVLSLPHDPRLRHSPGGAVQGHVSFLPYLNFAAAALLVHDARRDCGREAEVRQGATVK